MCLYICIYIFTCGRCCQNKSIETKKYILRSIGHKPVSVTSKNIACSELQRINGEKKGVWSEINEWQAQVHVQWAVLLIHTSTWTVWRHSEDLGPWNEPWQGVRRAQLHPALPFTLYEHEALQDSTTQDRSLVCLSWYKFQQVLAFFECWGLFVSTTSSGFWGLVHPAQLSARICPLMCVMGSPEHHSAFILLKCCVWELYKHTSSKSLISRGKGIWGSFWGSEPRVGTRVCVSSRRKDSAHPEGGWLRWAPESCTNWSKLFVSLSFIVLKGERHHNNQKVSGEALNPYQTIYNLLDSNMIYF